MKTFKILFLCALAMGLLSACTLKPIPKHPRSSLTTILTDRTLWGKDYPGVLAYLQGWNKIGEPTVAVFPTIVVGTTFYKDTDEVRKKGQELSRVLQEVPPQLNRDFEFLLTEARLRPPPCQVKTFMLPETSATQIQCAGPSLQLVAPELGLAVIVQRFGKPEKVTREVTELQKGQRPVVLTLHHYADGAVIFVETDWDPRPGTVNRILLDVHAVIELIF